MRYQAKAEGFMAKLAKRPYIRHGFETHWAIAAIAIVISTSLWLLASPPAEVEAQTPSGPAVSRSSPSASILDLRPGTTQQFTVSATAGDSIITGGKWFIDNVSQAGQSLALTQSTDRTTSYTFSTASTYRVDAEFADEDGGPGSVSWAGGATPVPTDFDLAPGRGRRLPT